MSDSEPINEAPVKRGRGRPRKDPSAPAAVKKPSAPAAASAIAGDSVSNGASAVVKGKRGRKPGTTNKPKAAAKSAGEGGAAPGAKRGRGRPRKTDAAPKKKAKKAASSESEGQDPESSLEESDE